MTYKVKNGDWLEVTVNIKVAKSEYGGACICGREGETGEFLSIDPEYAQTLVDLATEVYTVPPPVVEAKTKVK